MALVNADAAGMNGVIMARIEFTEREATLHKAIVVSFDLTGFSEFCNQPDPLVATVIPKLIKRMFDSLNATLHIPDESANLTILSQDEDTGPVLNKFMGDGALMAWVRPMKEDLPQAFCNQIVTSMRSFQTELSNRLPAWETEWRVHKLPRQVRIGIATGVVYALRRPHLITALKDPYDYAGYCINLAVRLQSYCPRLGFLVHGPLHPELPGMEFYTATSIKGGQSEPVALFGDDRSRVPEAEFAAKFMA